MTDLDAEKLPSDQMNEWPKVGGGERRSNVHKWVKAVDHAIDRRFCVLYGDPYLSRAIGASKAI